MKSPRYFYSGLSLNDNITLKKFEKLQIEKMQQEPYKFHN